MYICERGHVTYATSLLHGNAAMSWRELVKAIIGWTLGRNLETPCINGLGFFFISVLGSWLTACSLQVFWQLARQTVSISTAQNNWNYALRASKSPFKETQELDVELCPWKLKTTQMILSNSEATAYNTLQNSPIHSESQKDSGSKPNNPTWKCTFLPGHVE